MASQIETVLKNQMLNGTGSPESYLYMGLLASDGVTEISGGSYARKAFTWGTSTTGVKSLSAPVQFDGLPACTIGHAAIFTAPTGGTRGAIDDLATPRTVVAGDSYVQSTFNINLP